ncbi:L,D-transpeptidase family protein [Streptomyces sp900105755]|uniref:L,D-transpeptidase family protein n=1 Tax=Streptomyces sp. 900105755 TaxID=3154389 RepID=UPI003324D62B
MRRGVVTTFVSMSLLLLGAAPGATDPQPLPAQMADAGGGSQLITAEASALSSTSGTVTWWERRDGQWTQVGSAAARFGAKGLVEGAERQQGTNTTPTGLYDLPFGFGLQPAPAGTAVEYRPVTANSWWCQDNDSASYNRWVEPLPSDCRAAESEKLSSYTTQYGYALVIGFNYAQPVRGRGAGIFLHVDGAGATAGCVSVPEDAMRRILQWTDPKKGPHIAIGTVSGDTALTRY